MNKYSILKGATLTIAAPRDKISVYAGMVESVDSVDLGAVTAGKVFSMDVWMISRKELKNDLLDVFSALGDLQYQFDWVISDHDMWYSQNCPEEVRKRWLWTGILMPGQELTEHLSAGYVYFCCGAVLSAVPLGTRPEQVWDYIPGWKVNFEDPDYQFQTPLTQLEILCYDGYAWVIICKPEFSEFIKKALPQARCPKEFYHC